MLLKNVRYVQANSQIASNAVPRNASSVKTVPYLLEPLENVNRATLITIIAPHADQPQIASPASRTFTSQVVFANYVQKMSLDASHVKQHLPKLPALPA